VTDALLVLTTVSSEEQAAKLARALVERRLAACVNIVPGVRSLYRFKGLLEDDREQLLLMKTTRERYDALAAAISELHPYEVPELLAVRVERGAASYLGWVAESLSEPPDRSG
jgi:periplasmic divalent cation tolerance protein